MKQNEIFENVVNIVCEECGVSYGGGNYGGGSSGGMNNRYSPGYSPSYYDDMGERRRRRANGEFY